MPPVALGAAKRAFLLYRRPKLVVKDVHFRRCDGLIIANACQAEQIGWKLRTFGMEDECPAHAENPTKKASFEHDIVSGRSQTRLQYGCWRAGGRPVVLTEDEGREVNLAGKLQKAF